jgi:hypothetical protein
MNTRVKVLDWKPVPGRKPKSHDCYAVHGTDTWMVKRAGDGRNTSYVVRLNGGVVSRQETLKESKDKAEQLCLDRESVR